MNHQPLSIVSLCAFMCWLAPQPAQAKDLPIDHRVPGGIAVIPLNKTDQAYFYAGKAVLKIVKPSDQSAYAIVGIGLDAQPGPASLKDSDGNAIDFQVQAKQYRQQYLKVPPGMVNLSAKDLARHEKEQAHLAQVIEQSKPAPPIDLAMIAPSEGRHTASFGVRRFFNGQPRNPHNGLDIAAPTGTIVVAPLAGTVTDIGNYFFAGNAVWLDHGGGLLSMLCHLSRIDVKVGDELKQGQPVGAVGVTGRVTGPHLHWSVNLNGNMVNPALFLPVAKQQR